MAGFVSFGVSEQWNGGRVTSGVALGGAAGVTRGAEFLKSMSVPLAPLDRGPLRESATVRPATANTAEAWLIFDTPYAAIQHEAEDFEHSDGQAHYVSEPMDEYQRHIQNIIATEIRSYIARA